MNENMKKYSEAAKKIDEIRTYFNTCPTAMIKLGKMKEKAIFTPEEIHEYLNELEQIVFKELNGSVGILAREDAIYTEAHAKAREIIEAARFQIENHPIVEQAKVMAKQIVVDAETKAKGLLEEGRNIYNQSIRDSHQYCDALLVQVESEIESRCGMIKNVREGLKTSLQEKVEYKNNA